MILSSEDGSKASGKGAAGLDSWTTEADDISSSVSVGRPFEAYRLERTKTDGFAMSDEGRHRGRCGCRCSVLSRTGRLEIYINFLSKRKVFDKRDSIRVG